MSKKVKKRPLEGTIGAPIKIKNKSLFPPKKEGRNPVTEGKEPSNGREGKGNGREKE